MKENLILNYDNIHCFENPRLPCKLESYLLLSLKVQSALCASLRSIFHFYKHVTFKELIIPLSTQAYCY